MAGKLTEKPRRADKSWYNNCRRSWSCRGTVRPRPWALRLVQPHVISRDQNVTEPGGTSVRCDGVQGPEMTVMSGPKGQGRGSSPQRGHVGRGEDRQVW